MRSVDELLTEVQALAERQLRAAKDLDTESLREATDRRTDLVFEIQAAETAGQDLLAVRERVQTLARLDRRLVRVLRAASDTFSAGTMPAPTYNKTGRFRGRAA